MRKAFLFTILLMFTFLMPFENRGHGRGFSKGRPTHPSRERGWHGHGNGHIGRPVHLPLGRPPLGGWRGQHYFFENHTYFVWNWGPWAPWWNWNYYEGWRVGLWYYVPEGLRCYVDNPQISGEWMGQESYYYSDDAISSALGYCENDPQVVEANVPNLCRIRDCVRW